MKQAAITGERQATLVDVPEPKPVGNWAVVKVHAAPMCTECKAFVSGENPFLMGHEAAGEVVAVAQPCRVQIGDRVACMPLVGCGACEYCLAGDYIHCSQAVDFVGLSGQETGHATMAQYIVKPDWLLPKIPDGMSYEQGGLTCCALGPSFGALEAMDADAFDKVLVTGLGPVGLGAVVNARYRGARVIAVESHPWRSARAQQMGVDAVIDPRADDAPEQIRALTGGRGVDCALDCSGTVEAQRLCIDAARRKGKVAFIGECNDDLAIRVSPDMIRKGLTLIGAWHYNLTDFGKVLQVIENSPLIELLVSHVLPMSRIQEAFELQASGACAKVILQPWA
jgi:L-iditol 2-dehydrogenase